MTLTQTTVTPEEAKIELAKRELARRRLGRFSRYHRPDYDENWHHRKLTDALERVERGELQFLMVFMPPQNGKSTIVSEDFPAWFLGKHPEKNIIAGSYSADLATSFGRKTRNIVDSTDYHNLFPSVTLSEDSKAAGQWNTNKGGSYTAVGVGGGATGRAADIFIIDDPVKDKQEAESPVIQERNYGWYKTVVRTRLSPKGAIIVVQTRWHDQDLAGQILASESGWEVISLPAIAEQDEEFRKAGEALWPGRYSLEWLLKQQQALGTEAFSALYQQSPITEQSQIFKRSFFKYKSIDSLQDVETRCFVTIDPAPGKTQAADFIGVCVNWVTRDNFWHLRAFRVKFDAPALIELFFKLYNDYRFEKIGIEKGTYHDVFKPFLDAEMLKRNKFFSVEELDHKQRNKENRIRGLTPRYEAGQIFHLIGFCDELETELLRFPKSAHDDVSDATAYQLQIAMPPFGADVEVEVALNRRDRDVNVRADAGL